MFQKMVTFTVFFLENPAVSQEAGVEFVDLLARHMSAIAADKTGPCLGHAWTLTLDHDRPTEVFAVGQSQQVIVRS